MSVYIGIFVLAIAILFVLFGISVIIEIIGDIIRDGFQAFELLGLISGLGFIGFGLPGTLVGWGFIFG